MPLHCRFYENQYPEKDDVVMVNITSIQTMGSYVELLEYKNIGGMILHSELSRRRIRSINKLVRVGRTTVVMVIRVDSDKGYIDLSKRRVSTEEVAKCQDRFAKAKAVRVVLILIFLQVNQILRHTAEKLGYETDEQLEELCRKTSWYFDNKFGKHGASYDVFKRVVNTPSLLDECDIDDNTREVLLQNIRHRLTPQAMKIRANFEVSCFTYEGIDAVRRALKSGLELTSEELPIRINLIAPPLYVLTAQTMEWSDGVEHLNRVLETIKQSIESQGGTFKIEQAPRLVSDTDEADLRRQMAELEEANREVSGDEDEDDAGGDEDDEGEENEDDADENSDK
ncbi:Eukaryotic translation initiation factor [Fasciolopsis buskii]|uniref:Eukaryotic translation initiation factor 2 subunit 1 n=1 Tax=Fasciolopsis buskii TaxID=27845 RepID=A0A8E0RMG2_9TREM|nr:Eukaryotic translation initiation factor [Fasciolopsis buski]